MAQNNALSETMKMILGSDLEYRGKMLGRMLADCKYYLGMGNRYAKHLWSGDVDTHIANMKAIWNSFPEDQKPAGLTMEELETYERRMKTTLLFSSVTMCADGCESTFYIGGIPREQDDLTDSSDYEEFMSDIAAGTEVQVSVEAYLFGEGETQAASEDELRVFRDIEEMIPDIRRTRCDNIEDLEFHFLA